jgi:ATP/maltotriose-dependent transcriptional regulator MalT
MQLGRFDEVETLLAEVAALERQARSVDSMLLVEAGQYAAYLAWHQGQYKRARELYANQLALMRTRKTGVPRMVTALTGLAMVAVVQGDYATARACLREAFSAEREVLTGSLDLEPLLALSMLVLAEGQPQRAAILLGGVSVHANAAGHVPGPLERADWERCASAAREQLGEADFEAALAQGQAMSPEEATDFARAWLQLDG